jgi:hypothetical protein
MSTVGTTAYIPLIDAASELGLSDRQVRYLCEQGQLGSKMGKHWVITREELSVFKSVPRRGPGRPPNKTV